MKYLPLLFLSFSACAQSPFTDFYINNTSGGSTNSGHTPGGPIFAFQSGSWSTVTGDFTAPGADLSGVTNNGWLSVYNDGATVGVSSILITNVDDALDIIHTAGTGNFVAVSGLPTTGAGNRSCVFGGAWNMPNGNTTDWPFDGMRAQSVGTNSYRSCLNIKSNLYTLTGVIGSITDPGRIQGYNIVPRDGGRPTITSGAVASFVMFALSSVGGFYDIILDCHNFTSGSSAGITGSTRDTLRRVTVIGAKGSGFSSSSDGVVYDTCESYSNTLHGFSSANTGGATLVNCISHHNGSSGFFTGAGTFNNCISYSNSQNGFESSTAQGMTYFYNCDAYNNRSNGFSPTSVQGVVWKLLNCNSLKNGRYAFEQTAVGYRGDIISFGVGAGTMTNLFGTFSPLALTYFESIGLDTYPNDVTPWVDPENGNFNLVRTYGKIGFGTFMNSLTNVISYPYRGSQQYPGTNILGGNSTWSQ